MLYFVHPPDESKILMPLTIPKSYFWFESHSLILILVIVVKEVEAGIKVYFWKYSYLQCSAFF